MITAAEAIRDMRRRAAEIAAAHKSPNSYYHVAGDEPVDYLLDGDVIPWADAIERELTEHEKRNVALCHLILEAQGANKRKEPLDWWLDSAMGWLKEYRDKEAP